VTLRVRRPPDGVVVVEHHHPLRRGRVIACPSDVVDQRGHGDGHRGGVQGTQDFFVDVEASPCRAATKWVRNASGRCRHRLASATQVESVSETPQDELATR